MRHSDRSSAFAAMTNQQLMDHGNKMMDETDQAIERSKQVRVLSERMMVLVLLGDPAAS